MTVFFRKSKNGFSISTECMDELEYRANTIEQALEYFKEQFGITPTKLVELK